MHVGELEDDEKTDGPKPKKPSSKPPSTRPKKKESEEKERKNYHEYEKLQNSLSDQVDQFKQQILIENVILFLIINWLFAGKT